MWDYDLYPVINKTSIYKHGQYCQSGLAYMKKDNKWIAECVTIDEITLSKVDPKNKTLMDAF